MITMNQSRHLTYDLCKAASVGDLVTVKELIAMGTTFVFDNNSPIVAAFKCGQIDIIKYFVESGYNIKDHEDVYLIRAVEGGHTAIVRYLYDNGVDILNYNSKLNLIETACFLHQWETVEYLLNRCPTHIVKKEVVEYAKFEANMETLRLLISRSVCEIGLSPDVVTHLISKSKTTVLKEIQKTKELENPVIIKALFYCYFERFKTTPLKYLNKCPEWQKPYVLEHMT